MRRWDYPAGSVPFGRIETFPAESDSDEGRERHHSIDRAALRISPRLGFDVRPIVRDLDYLRRK